LLANLDSIGLKAGPTGKEGDCDVEFAAHKFFQVHINKRKIIGVGIGIGIVL
jgi:hypothetical protein